MANIYLADSSAHRGKDFEEYPRVRIEESYQQDVHKKHSLVRDPDSADIILFATNHYFPPLGLGIYKETLFRKYRHKTVVLNNNDYPSPVVGGLCASWEGNLETIPGMAQGWAYYHPSSAEPTIEFRALSDSPAYLWSFKGASENHPVRGRLFATNDPRAFLEDTSKQSIPNLRQETRQEEQQNFLSNYRELLYDSAFVACPLGKGASSMRIFEAMRAGRCPVIISDAWRPPPFIDWEVSSIRLPEAEVEKLPEILRSREAEASQLGVAARQEWERVLGPTGLFHYTVEACQSILQARKNSTTAQQLASYAKVLEPKHARVLLRYLRQSLGQGNASRLGSKTKVRASKSIQHK